MNNAARKRHPGFESWMQKNKIANIVIVSPHLDDAVFSLAAFMALQGLPPIQVVTFITKAGDEAEQQDCSENSPAQGGGEYAERRQEDILALQSLGAGCLHLNAPAVGFGDGDVARSATKILSNAGGRPMLILLPLGAGAELSHLQRILHRALRRPFGSVYHGEHVWVRDMFRKTLEPGDMTLGYYAEIPYQCANSRGELTALAALCLGPRFQTIKIEPDVDDKLEAVRRYKTQFGKEFGGKEWYQRRTASTTERLYLPE